MLQKPALLELFEDHLSFELQFPQSDAGQVGWEPATAVASHKDGVLEIRLPAKADEPTALVQ